MYLSFKKGLLDALPIFFGYLSVGFAFGISAIANGYPCWSPVIMSATQVSGTGQAVIANNAASGFWTIITAVTVINLRYILMALAVAQRLPPGFGIFRRMLMAMGDTDEIVGVAVKQRDPLTFQYFMGLTVCSYIGWVGGTALAVLLASNSVMSDAFAKILGIALYAMFVAIIVPEARKSRPVLLCVLIAAAISMTGRYFIRVPAAGAWITLVAGITSALAAAFIFPKKEIAKEDK